MNYIVVVHVFNSIADLFDDRSDFIFRHRTSVFEVLVEVAAPAQFHQKVEVVVLYKGRIELNDVGMVQITLDFDLPDSLKEHLAVRA